MTSDRTWVVVYTQGHRDKWFSGRWRPHKTLLYTCFGVTSCIGMQIHGLGLLVLENKLDLYLLQNFGLHYLFLSNGNPNWATLLGAVPNRLFFTFIFPFSYRNHIIECFYNLPETNCGSTLFCKLSILPLLHHK